MANNIGRITTLAIGVESTFGTKASALTEIPWMSNFDPSPQKTLGRDTSAFGRIENQTQTDLIQEWSTPSFEAIVRQDVFGILMYAALGTVNTTGPTDTSVYTHAFTVKNDNTPKSLTISWEDSNESEMITGCVLNSMTWNYVSDDYVKVTVDFVGLKQETDTETFTYTQDNKYTAKMSTVKFAANVAGLGAASVINYQDASFTITKNAEPIWAIGSTEPTAIVNKTLEIAGDFNLVMSSETYRDLYLNNTVQAIQFDSTNTDVTIGAATNPSVTWVFAKCYITEYSYPRSEDDLVTQGFTFEAAYDLTDNMVDATLINETTSY